MHYSNNRCKEKKLTRMYEGNQSNTYTNLRLKLQEIVTRTISYYQIKIDKNPREKEIFITHKNC